MIQRKFFAGDEWLYFKIYCGIHTSDFLLIDSIETLVKELQENNLISIWFFVRYQDPNPHLRFRLRLINRDDVGDVISISNKYFRPFLEKDQVWKIQTDTYERELERYGINTITYVEEIFYSDSELVLEILNFTRKESEILEYVLISVDRLLKVFGLCSKERNKFHQANFSAYKERLGIKIGTFRVKANELQRKINISVKDRSLGEHQLHPTFIQTHIARRDEKIISSAKEIILHSQKSNSDINLYELLHSVVHMFFNKAFNNQQVMYECLGYYILLKRGNSELHSNEKE